MFRRPIGVSEIGPAPHVRAQAGCASLDFGT
jgi:hypothetical protein